MRAPMSFVLNGPIMASIVCVSLLLACEQESSIAEEMPPSKSLDELEQAKSNEMSEEELKAARKAAGFKSRDEVAAENAAAFEKDARKYVKARMKDYRALLERLRSTVVDVEKAAKSWAKAKKPKKAFERFQAKYEKRTKALTDRYNELTEMGSKGGETQAVLGKAYRNWEQLNGALDPEIANNEKFAETLKTIREQLDEVEAKLEEIAKDETLEGDAKGEGS